ncbi:MAG TPA: hypothetical protein DD716_04960 [Thiomicrospira sp.]|nr:hypothetical protein [Thiomicrospira sp.]
MSTVSEIQTKIEALPHNEYIKLVGWFAERDWSVWDKEIEKDSLSGGLDFLIDEALNEKTALKLKGL